jgi:uncharacterized membrane-anchored protein YitT (DUF2179 family)
LNGIIFSPFLGLNDNKLFLFISSFDNSKSFKDYTNKRSSLLLIFISVFRLFSNEIIFSSFMFGVEPPIGLILIFDDKVLLGISDSKAFYIVVPKNKDDLVRDFLVSLEGVGSTIIDAHGGYSNDKQTLILAVVPTKMYYLVKEGLAEIDKKIFYLVCDSYEVSNRRDYDE